MPLIFEEKSDRAFEGVYLAAVASVFAELQWDGCRVGAGELANALNYAKARYRRINQELKTGRKCKMVGWPATGVTDRTTGNLEELAELLRGA